MRRLPRHQRVPGWRAGCWPPSNPGRGSLASVHLHGTFAPCPNPLTTHRSVRLAPTRLGRSRPPLGTALHTDHQPRRTPCGGDPPRLLLAPKSCHSISTRHHLVYPHPAKPPGVPCTAMVAARSPCMHVDLVVMCVQLHEPTQRLPLKGWPGLCLFCKACATLQNRVQHGGVIDGGTSSSPTLPISLAIGLFRSLRSLFLSTPPSPRSRKRDGSSDERGKPVGRLQGAAWRPQAPIEPLPAPATGLRGVRGALRRCRPPLGFARSGRRRCSGAPAGSCPCQCRHQAAASFLSQLVAAPWNRDRTAGLHQGSDRRSLRTAKPNLPSPSCCLFITHSIMHGSVEHR